MFCVILSSLASCQETCIQIKRNTEILSYQIKDLYAITREILYRVNQDIPPSPPVPPFPPPFPNIPVYIYEYDFFLIFLYCMFIVLVLGLCITYVCCCIMYNRSFVML